MHPKQSAGEESDDMNRAFSELSSYHSGTSEPSSEYTSEDSGSTDESSSSGEGSSGDADGTSTDDSEYGQ
ncbi:hypothetical protein OESDEN_05353 [Oesophagostomum dentatum]|uniref:Uncharacterized protein n=1 Tax=Oesophagostomum dentatum TaxID=61180 RepID=A0A0B1TAZ4_OESDE|nr:hypothetical protein OESDEN_05353 [Oesophagostomum dentatum]